MIVEEIPDRDRATLEIAYVPPFVELGLSVELVNNSKNHKEADWNECDHNEKHNENSKEEVWGGRILIAEHFENLLKKVEVPPNLIVDWTDCPPQFSELIQNPNFFF